MLTSGSTGRPKAVAVAEDALGTLLDWYRGETGLAPGTGTPAHRGGVRPARAGAVGRADVRAALVPAPDAVRWDAEVLTEWWREAAVSVAVAATPMVEPLLDRPWSSGLTLRHLTVGGDRMRRRPGPDVTATVHNAYGPAEATVLVTSYAMRGTDPEAGGEARRPSARRCPVWPSSSPARTAARSPAARRASCASAGAAWRSATWIPS
ncbi:hypothetical protein PQR15_00905 [Streptomyces lydicus]|nr:hypothetical protein [Streptomyces lydicus]